MLNRKDIGEMVKLELTEKEKNDFLDLVKKGVYKEMHKREVLTERQLMCLLEQLAD